MKLTKAIIAAPLVAVILLITTGAPIAKAWNFGGSCGFSCSRYGPSAYCGGEYSCCCATNPGGGCPDNCQNYDNRCGGYCAGQIDAQYDIQNSLQYSPIGQCLPCHSQGYWDNFREGYNSYWNSHQNQEQSENLSQTREIRTPEIR